jgi:ribosomal protein L32
MISVVFSFSVVPRKTFIDEMKNVIAFLQGQGRDMKNLCLMPMASGESKTASVHAERGYTSTGELIDLGEGVRIYGGCVQNGIVILPSKDPSTPETYVYTLNTTNDVVDELSSRYNVHLMSMKKNDGTTLDLNVVVRPGAVYSKVNDEHNRDLPRENTTDKVFVKFTFGLDDLGSDIGLPSETVFGPALVSEPQVPQSMYTFAVTSYGGACYWNNDDMCTSPGKVSNFGSYPVFTIVVEPDQATWEQEQAAVQQAALQEAQHAAVQHAAQQQQAAHQAVCLKEANEAKVPQQAVCLNGANPAAPNILCLVMNLHGPVQIKTLFGEYLNVQRNSSDTPPLPQESEPSVYHELNTENAGYVVLTEGGDLAWGNQWAVKGLEPDVKSWLIQNTLADALTPNNPNGTNAEQKNQIWRLKAPILDTCFKALELRNIWVATMGAAKASPLERFMRCFVLYAECIDTYESIRLIPLLWTGEVKASVKKSGGASSLKHFICPCVQYKNKVGKNRAKGDPSVDQTAGFGLKDIKSHLVTLGCPYSGSQHVYHHLVQDCGQFLPNVTASTSPTDGSALVALAAEQAAAAKAEAAAAKAEAAAAKAEAAAKAAAAEAAAAQAAAAQAAAAQAAAAQAAADDAKWLDSLFFELDDPAFELNAI